jgi:hypothetical protein
MGKMTFFTLLVTVLPLKLTERPEKGDTEFKGPNRKDLKKRGQIRNSEL